MDVLFRASTSSPHPERRDKVVVQDQTVLSMSLNEDEGGEKRTSGSVRHLPITMMPVVNNPSVNTGPKNLCIFGVKRKGTASLDANTGA
jgi:hypothetical protein